MTSEVRVRRDGKAMLVSCPSCQSEYRVDDAQALDGRTMRCARCRAQWMTEPRAAPVAMIEPRPAPIMGIEDAAPLDAIDVADTFDGGPNAPAPVRRKRKPVFAWRRSRPAPRASRGPKAPLARPVSIFAAAGCAALGLLVGERVTVVKATPSLASLYATIGLDTNVRGLAIRDVRSSEEIDEGVPLLLVTGSVSNVSAGAVDVPRLRIAVRSSDGRDVYAWTTVVGRATLGPGEAVPFRARLASPPAEGRSIAVRFLGRQDMAAPAARQARLQGD